MMKELAETFKPITNKLEKINETYQKLQIPNIYFFKIIYPKVLKYQMI